MKHKVILIVGTRPNLVKAAPVYQALVKNGEFEPLLVHTGQHYDTNLSGKLVNELSLPQPVYFLGVGSGRQAWQLGEMVSGLDTVIKKEKPAAALVFGDSNSTAAGAIAASKSNIPVAHIEAGLREFDKRIPEEVNKLLTTSVADLFFCPTKTGVKNLAAIGITENVHLVGDVGIDLICKHLERIDADNNALEKYHIEPGNYYFSTCHRAANTDSAEPLREILKALEAIELPVVFPIHPRTAKAIEKYGLPKPETLSHVRVVPPIGFFETQSLIRKAKAVITDSGGIVKEAYFHKTPGIIIDKQIEWIETVEEGWNHIAGPDSEKILGILEKLEIPKLHSGCLGDGTASEKIASILTNYLSVNRQPSAVNRCTHA